MPVSAAYERPAERFAHLTAGGGIALMLEQADTGDRLHPRTALEHPCGRGMNLSMDDEVGELELTVVDPDGYLLRPTQNLGTRG